METGKLLLHSVSFAEFDIDVGNTLTHRYPQFTLAEYDDEYLGNCCLPDGGHIHREDRTFLVLQVRQKTKVTKKSKKNKQKKKEDGDEESTEKEQLRTLYGVAYFVSRTDSTVKRGALQKSILVLSYHPYFDLYYLPAKATLERYLDDKTGKDGKNLLKNFYESVQAMEKTQNFQLNLYGEQYPINIPVLEEDQFEGASLVELINHFGVDTIIIWYCMLLQKRILFVGQPAREVGNCCLAAPLLVRPLIGWTRIITPYVALTDISPVMRQTYICGSTNLLFETKTDWWDALGSFSSGHVLNTCGIRPSRTDIPFMKNIISGINDNRGEEWVRTQFYSYTTLFLINLDDDKLQKDHRKYFANFKDSNIYLNYKTQTIMHVQSAESQQGPTATFQQLKESMENPDLASKAQQTKMLYALSTNLKDLTHIEEVCNLDGVTVIGAVLNENNSQMRKYAVQVLAQLALSLSGQIAMMSDQVLTRVIELLKDPMPNVANAAIYCLLKISTLYIGVQTLVSHGVTALLTELLCDPESILMMKTRCAATLLQIYRFSPNTPKPPGLKKYLHSQLKSPDKDYKLTILQLLDQWGEELPQIPLSRKIKDQMQALLARNEDEDSTPNFETRVTASTFLLSDLVKSPEIRLELVEAGGVEAILENAKLNDPSNRLPRYSFALLSMVADSNFGRKKILRYRIIELAIQLLSSENSSNQPLFLFTVSRLLEVCAQHKDTGAFFLECNGVSTVISFLESCHQSKQALLAIPALGTLRYLMISFGAGVIEEVRNNPNTIKLLYEMLIESTESDGDQSGNRKLRELTCSVLRMCGESS